jgi:IS5 family transposase
VLRETDPQTTMWELLLAEEAKRLPAELAAVDAYLDDECLSARGGRWSTAGWAAPRSRSTRCCGCCTSSTATGWATRACVGRSPTRSRGGGSAASVWTGPCPTRLPWLSWSAAPAPRVIEQLNAALVAKLAAGTLLRARKLRVDTTVVEADIDYLTDADLLEHAVRKLGGLVRRIKARGAARRTRFRDRGRAAGRRMQQLARTLRRRTGMAMAEGDRLTAQVAQIARQTLKQVQVVAGNARRAGAHRSGDGRLGRLVDELDETIAATQRLLAQTDQRLAGDRLIPDRLVSLSDPDARPIRKGKPRHPTQFGSTLLVTEEERGFIADHQLHQDNPPHARSWSHRCSGWWRSPAGHPGRWSATAASAPPPTTRPWKRSGSNTSGCNAPAPQARPGWRWSGPDGSGGCATGASASRPASATSNAPSGCGAEGCPMVGRWRPAVSASRDRSC